MSKKTAYGVNFSMLGGGYLEVQAESEDAASQIVSNMTTEELIALCSFKGGFDIAGVDDLEGPQDDDDEEEEA